MANITVSVTDANNITVQLTPVAAQNVTIDRGVAGNGISSIVPVTISTLQYLRIFYTNGTQQDVGPLTSTAYFGETPITIVGNTISLSTVPINKGGTNAITAAAAIQNLLPSYTGNGSKRLSLNSGATALEWVLDGGGTVTSVDVSGGTTGLTTSGGPITGSGTITLAGTLAVANGGTGVTTSTGTGSVVLSTSPSLVTPLLGTPTSGNFSTGTFTWPTFNQNTTGTAAGLSATLVIASGGTNGTATPTAGAVPYGTGTAYAFTAAGTAGQILQSNGASAPTWANLSSLGVSSFSAGTTGFTPSTATTGAVTLAGTLNAVNGGTGQSSYTTGDLLYSSATNTLSKLAIGTANRVMTSSGSAPQWVTALTGLTGVSSSSITNTSLTSGRVILASTGGLEADSANLTFDGTTLTTTGLSNSGTSALVKLVTVGNTSFNGTTVFAAATPAKLYMGTGTVTDTTSAVGATNAIGAVASLAITPIAATNTSVTYTNASTLYIAGAPSAGTNVTLTNPYALYVAAGNTLLGGNLLFTDNTYDIGASGATRPRNLYLGGTTLDIRNAGSVSATIKSTGGGASLNLDALTGGGTYSNQIAFQSNGVSKWVLGGGNVYTGGVNDFSLFNYATTQMVFNVPTGGNNVNFYGKLGINNPAGISVPLAVQADTNGSSMWSINDPTQNFSQIYFGGTYNSGFQAIRSDGRSTGWLRFLTNDTQRLNIDYLGAGTFYGTTWEFSQSYPYMNNIQGGSVRPMMAFNTAGTYYAGFFDSGLTSTSGSRQYFARTTGLGVAPSSVLLALDYQNNRVGIGTINPGVDFQVSNPSGAGSTFAVKALSSGTAALSLDSYTNSGGASTQINFLLQGAQKWSFGYANIGAGGANDMGIYDYTNGQTPWIMTSTDYQRLVRTAAFMATISSNYTSTGADVVRFSTVSATGCFDNRGNFDTGNYRFVAPVDGWYQFNVVVNQYSISGTFFEITLRKNTSINYAGGRIYSGGSSDQNVTTHAVIYLSQNDYVDVVSQQAGGFSANVRWNTFSGHLIG